MDNNAVKATSPTVIEIEGLSIDVYNFEWNKDLNVETFYHEPQQVIDKKWTSICECGAEHKADEKDEIANAEYVFVKSYWCTQCDDMHDDHELRCVHCRELVEPKYVTETPPPTHIAGVSRHVIKGRTLTDISSYAAKPNINLSFEWSGKEYNYSGTIENNPSFDGIYCINTFEFAGHRVEDK